MPQENEIEKSSDAWGGVVYSNIVKPNGQEWVKLRRRGCMRSVTELYRGGRGMHAKPPNHKHIQKPYGKMLFFCRRCK